VSPHNFCYVLKVTVLSQGKYTTAFNQACSPALHSSNKASIRIMATSVGNVPRLMQMIITSHIVVLILFGDN